MREPPRPLLRPEWWHLAKFGPPHLLEEHLRRLGWLTPRGTLRPVLRVVIDNTPTDGRRTCH